MSSHEHWRRANRLHAWPVVVCVFRQLKSWNLSQQKKGCACKRSPFCSFFRKYPVACTSLWYCWCDTYSSIALVFLSQHRLWSERVVGYICMFGGRSSKNFYEKCQFLTLSSSWAMRTLLSYERLLSACSNMSQVNAVNPEFLTVLALPACRIMSSLVSGVEAAWQWCRTWSVCYW